MQLNSQKIITDFTAYTITENTYQISILNSFKYGLTNNFEIYVKNAIFYKIPNIGFKYNFFEKRIISKKRILNNLIISTSIQYNLSIPYFFLFFSSIKKKYNYNTTINDFFLNNESKILISLTKKHRTWCSNVKSNLLTFGIGVNKNFGIRGDYTSNYNSIINYLTYNYNPNTHFIFEINFLHGSAFNYYNITNKIFYDIEKKEIFWKTIVFTGFMLNFKFDSWFNIGLTNFYSSTNKYKIYPYIDIIVNFSFRTNKNQLFDKKIYKNSKIRNI